MSSFANRGTDRGVVVLASERSDRQLVRELLRGAGLCKTTDKARLAESVDIDLGGDSGGDPPACPCVTIICHRTSRDFPRPELPDGVAGRVVVLSDCTSESVVVEALEAGARHYFDITEPRRVLQARLFAALRSCPRHVERELLVPPFRFDLRKRRVWREEQLIGLSPKEFDLAYYLFSHRGRTIGNSELMTAVWSLPRSMDTRRIDTASCRVRKKMRLEAPYEPWRLRRLRNEGYLVLPSSEESSRSPQPLAAAMFSAAPSVDPGGLPNPEFSRRRVRVTPTRGSGHDDRADHVGDGRHGDHAARPESAEPEQPSRQARWSVAR